MSDNELSKTEHEAKLAAELKEFLAQEAKKKADKDAAIAESMRLKAIEKAKLAAASAQSKRLATKNRKFIKSRQARINATSQGSASPTDNFGTPTNFGGKDSSHLHPNIQQVLFEIDREP